MIRFVVDTIARLMVRRMARIRVFGRGRIPATGPVIIATNHINFFETPLIYLLLKHLNPRPFTKIEHWDRLLTRIIANLWGAIPIRRGAVDTQAFSTAVSILSNGGAVVVAPEGTRSRHGRLQKANAGVVLLATRSGAPILPVVHWGGEQVMESLTRLRRAVVRIRVGELLNVDAAAVRSRDGRDAELNRIMRTLAAMLPEQYRGYYA